MAEWIRQERDAIRRVCELRGRLGLADAESDGIARAAEVFPLKITPYYLGLIDPDDPSCPIRRMVVPDARELRIAASELDDPIGDERPAGAGQALAALTHRYPDRVLIHPTTLCGTYCRHCFRRRLVGSPERVASQAQLDAAIAYVERHPEVREAILTGGDPLMLGDAALAALLGRLRRIPHLRVLRIHTRMPVVNPYRITDALAELLAGLAPLWLAVQVNHPKEFTETVVAHLARLADRGIPLLSQSVLLKGVNDDAAVLRELSWRSIEARVRPYYLHHLDRARGLSHLRVSARAGLGLMKALRGTLPGYAIPEYVLDIPGGHGKVPLGHPYLCRDARGLLYAETLAGHRVPYADDRDEPPADTEAVPPLRPLVADDV